MTRPLDEALKDPEFYKWWSAKEKYVVRHYTENPHIDKYLVTVETEVEFARENDGVLNEHDVEMWLQAGEIELEPGHRILKIKKVD